jgi:hypothetical protein
MISLPPEAFQRIFPIEKKHNSENAVVTRIKKGTHGF